MLEQLRDAMERATSTGDYREFAQKVRAKVDDESLARTFAGVSKMLSELPEIEFEHAFLNALSHENKWHEACTAFDSVRSVSLAEEEKSRGTIRESVLLYQENVLKHLCLIRGNLRRFDKDSAEWAIVCLMHLKADLAPNVATAIANEFLLFGD